MERLAKELRTRNDRLYEGDSGEGAVDGMGDNLVGRSNFSSFVMIPGRSCSALALQVADL